MTAAGKASASPTPISAVDALKAPAARLNALVLAMSDPPDAPGALVYPKPEPGNIGSGTWAIDILVISQAGYPKSNRTLTQRQHRVHCFNQWIVGQGELGVASCARRPKSRYCGKNLKTQ